MPSSHSLRACLKRLYEYEEPSKHQLLIGGQGTPIGDRVVLGKIRLLPQDYSATQITPAPIAIWQPGIQLLAADVMLDEQGRPGQIQLQWQARTHLHEVYTLFIQILRSRWAASRADRPAAYAPNIDLATG